MKLGKLSLVAVMALGTSAFAIDNIKVNGQAKLIYQTSDVEMSPAEQTSENVDTGLFNRGQLLQRMNGAPYGGGAAGGTSLTFGLTADLASNLSFGSEVQMYSTLGLENNLVSDVMVTPNSGVNDAWAFSQMWLASTFGKTTFKVGRMELDTPLAFTEKWNIIKNTFEGAVVLNSDIPQTTLVAAWVGKHNGSNDALTLPDAVTGTPVSLGINLLSGSSGRTANLDGAAGSGSNPFVTFGSNGAYALAAINSSIPGTTVQAWYYELPQLATAMWLQADAKIAGMVSLGAQYAVLDPQTNVDTVLGANVEDSAIWALKAGVDVAGMNFYAAYSKANDGGVTGFANVATGDKTKIYTGDGSVYMDGIVTAPGTRTTKLGMTAKVADVALAASYTMAKDYFNVSDNNINGWDVSAATKVGAVNLQAIYTLVDNSDVSTEYDPRNLGALSANAFYGGRDLETIRLIATLPF
jgi:imipenem/basic amino acid-specific outer membrane pore